MKFREYLLKSKIDYVGYLKRIEENGGDQDLLDWYIQQLDKANKGNYTVYRGIYAKDKNKINKNKLGTHWCLDKNIPIGNIEGEKKEGDSLFILKAKSVPNSVDKIQSLDNFTQIPDENEINFNIQPTLIGISEK